jgi:hypothetical protein
MCEVGVRLMALATLAVLAPAPAASAGERRTFQGITRQQQPVTIVVKGNGRIEKVRIAWTTRDCRRPRATYEGDTEVYGFDRLTRTRFAHREPVIRGDRRRRLLSFTTVTMRGRLVRGGRRVADRWVGTIRARTTIRRGGRVYDRCRLRTTRWRAGRHIATLRLESEPGDPVGGGRSSTASHRDSDVTEIASRPELLWVQFEGDDQSHWSAMLWLEDEPPRAEISGNGRSCALSTASEMRVRRARRDRRGRVRYIDATFVQWCSENPAALRGRITFRRGY